MKITEYDFSVLLFGKSSMEQQVGVLKLIWEGRIMFLLMFLFGKQ